MNNKLLELSTDVQSALQASEAVVALESTIITHGMPYPDNLVTAKMVEQSVRDQGALPATIAVLDGRIKVGLSDAELERLAHTSDAMKLSRADLAFAIARGVTGSTTVAATMIAAHLAGIRVFATGGIGGVHQGAQDSFDISADLQELSRTPVIVVSAGPKAILDIPKTMEVLETHGVPVVSMGQDNLPAFWSRDSGLPSPLRVDSASELVAFENTRQLLGITGGMLVANPVPESAEIPKAEMDAYIARAVADAQSAGKLGKSVTPWLLDHIFKLTDGRSLDTNKALIINNATLAARIAKALANASASKH